MRSRKVESRHVGKILIETYGLYDSLDLLDPKISEEERAHRERQFYTASQEKIHLAMGDQRFSEYQRASDADYEKTVLIAERYGLGDQVANQCYEMRIQAQKAVNDLRENTAYTDEDRRALLGEVKDEVLLEFSKMWGVSAFETYKKYQGEWLDKMFANAEWK